MKGMKEKDKGCSSWVDSVGHVSIEGIIIVRRTMMSSSG